MVLSCAAIMRDSVSLLWFILLSHEQETTCAISLVCRLKYPYSCFSSVFFFLVFVVFFFWLLLLVFLCSFECTLRMPVLLHPHNFQSWWDLYLLLFLTHIICLCRTSGVAPCALLCLLVLWSFCRRFSLVHFKNGPEYLTKRKTPGVYSLK